MAQTSARGKLLVTVALLLGITAAVSLVSIYAVDELGGELSTTIGRTTRKIQLTKDLEARVLELRVAQRGVIMFTMASNEEAIRRSREKFRETAGAVGKGLRELGPLLDTDEARSALTSIDRGLSEWQAVEARIAELCFGDKLTDAINVMTEQLTPLAERMQTQAQLIAAIQQRALAASASRASDMIFRERMTVFALLFIGVCVGAGALVFMRHVAKQLHVVSQRVVTSAEQVAGAAGQVASSSQGLAQGASEQAASLEETSASTEEITSITEKNADGTTRAAGLMAEVDQRIGAANETLAHMASSMNEITASSDKVSRIIRVIDEIAFQTNILALNAAVEAARAGEAGLGFAVVAGEVRNLAQRSAQAAKDTAALIGESIARSNAGTSKLEQMTSVVREVTDAALKAKLLVDEIHVSGQEQARGIRQIANAVTHMDSVTQQTAANAEQGAAASEQLSGQARDLQELAAQLMVLVSGRA